MYFESITELLRMNGHGGYVWASYIAMLTILIANFAMARRKVTTQLEQLRWRRQIQEQSKADSMAGDTLE